MRPLVGIATTWVATAMAVACSGACSSSPAGGVDAPLGADAIDASTRQAFRDCRGRAFTLAPTQTGRHTIASPATVALGPPNHSANDPIDPGSSVTLRGKFTYGAVSKDLEDEDVRVSIDDCSDWRVLGDAATDADGRISISVAPGTLPGPGVYEARLQVLGDQSVTTAYVWLLPIGTRIALTDIDGTMTSSDFQLFQQILDGSHVPVAYPGAVGLTTAHAERGHALMYLTGRPYWLTQKTRDWLSDLGFGAGALRVTDSSSEGLPTEGGVGEFKKAFINSMVSAGYSVDLAYGNASTDIYAYLGAGIAADHVWIIGSNAGDSGTNPVMDSWTARIGEVQALPIVTQPFDW